MSDMRSRLDEVFSCYIRRRDFGDGHGRCITCGRPITYSSCDAGHYIGRSHTATRWNEMNVHAQCRDCNRVHYGRMADYRSALIRRYGRVAVEQLEAQRRREVHLTADMYRQLIDYYTNKIKQL